MYVDILCERRNPAAIYPTRAYEYDAAWDLYSVQYAQVGPTSIVIDTGIACALPRDYCAVLFGRSGLASQSLTPIGWVIEEDGRIRLGGVMDAGYRGNYKVMLACLGGTTHLVKPHEAVAQMLILPRPASRIIPVDPMGIGLPPSQRGIKGFGSSDPKAPPPEVYSPLRPYGPETKALDDYERAVKDGIPQTEVDQLAALAGFHAKGFDQTRAVLAVESGDPNRRPVANPDSLMGPFRSINPDVPSSGLVAAPEGPSGDPMVDPSAEAEDAPVGLLDASDMGANGPILVGPHTADGEPVMFDDTMRKSEPVVPIRDRSRQSQ